jgi:hypothetical protein
VTEVRQRVVMTNFNSLQSKGHGLCVNITINSDCKGLGAFPHKEV